MAGAGAAPPTIGARITPSTGNPSIALSICGTGSATGAAIAVKLETDSRKTTANKCLLHHRLGMPFQRSKGRDFDDAYLPRASAGEQRVGGFLRWKGQVAAGV